MISMTHEFDSVMLYIHPPLAIAGYVFVFLFVALLHFKRIDGKKLLDVTGIASWLFTFLGLITGMLWAQVAWGCYWSWDPKETMTLILFISVSASVVCHFEGGGRMLKLLSALSCVLVVLTILSSFILAGLHSFVS